MKRATKFYCACGCGRRVLQLEMPPKAVKLRLARIRREAAARQQRLIAAAAEVIRGHAERLPGDERPDQPAHAAPTMH